MLELITKTVRKAPLLGKRSREHAIRTYSKYGFEDNDPRIVRMIVDDTPVDHWYFRSNNFVDQPFNLPSLDVSAYTGRINGYVPKGYGEGTYVRDEDKTHEAVKVFLECFYPEYFGKV